MTTFAKPVEYAFHNADGATFYEIAYSLADVTTFAKMHGAVRHHPVRAPNRAYQVSIRRIATGADFHIRLFAQNPETAIQRATNRARVACEIPILKFRELDAKGVAVFRVVSCEISSDQSKPQDTNYDTRAQLPKR